MAYAVVLVARLLHSCSTFKGAQIGLRMALGMYGTSILEDHSADMNIAATAAVAGGAAVTAYLNARYHLGKDLDTLILLKRAQRDYNKAGSSSSFHHERRKQRTGQLIPKPLQ